MRRVVSVALLLVLVICTFTGCSDDSVDNYTGIGKSRALEIGKQEMVNHFCLEENVSRLRCIYGTEDVTRESDGDWKVHLLGHYCPVDAYGTLGAETRFAYTVHIDSTGEVLATFEY